MRDQRIISGALLAAGIFAVIVCVGMVTGFTAAKPFISVDLVGDKNIGDQFTVTGNTSLPAGSEIMFEVYPESLDLNTGLVIDPNTGSAVRVDSSVVTGVMRVDSNSGGIAAWSFPVNTASFMPGEYRVVATALVNDKPGDLSGITKFTVHGTLAPTGTAQYIRVDPVPDKTTGDLLIVSGSTNFPEGTDLMIQAASTNGGSKVRKGTGGVNVWSTPIDTSASRPGSYQITVTNMVGSFENGDYGKGTVNGTTPFTLKGAYLTTETPVKATITKDDYIRINAIGDRSVGEQFLVTGTTSLPVGTEVLWEITPDSIFTNPNQSGEFTGAMANSQVTKGEGTTNRVSYAMDTWVLLPEQYNVSVSTVVGNLSEGDYRTGNPTGNTLFTLKQGPASAGTGQYIKIDPVDEKTTGDLLIVSGSTNFPSGTILMVQIGSPGIGSGSDTIVREGTGGVNRYSMPADTALLKPGTQTITVTNMKGDLEKGDYELGNVNSTATFTLKGTYLGTDTPVQATVTKDDFIRLNAIGDKKVGDQFLITGKTSLPAGVGLIWQVMPYTGTVPTSLDMNTKGIMANNPVTKGDGAANRVSLAVDLGNMEPGEYIAMVGPMKGDPENRDIAMADPVGSTRFTVV
ncbi:MAG: hypothetical protein M0R30_13495 [Methanoregula sp.]|uniref:hypothetical protein n=1 Tax=Methanoregula sp. TaxID=2052170 RepID=UPI0025DC82A4|nr:hypothetical protein [Methanoregula sp.]MCK9632640.1 hypothetical protein [Methanoregula sp.]